MEKELNYYGPADQADLIRKEMKEARRIEVNGHPLAFIRYSIWAECHPDDSELNNFVCSMCAWARRLDTGELVLLWKTSDLVWVVNRTDKNYDRQRKELMETPYVG